MNYAIIEFGKVANIVESSPEYAQRNGWIPAEANGTVAQIGGEWDGTQFHPAPPAPEPVPEEVEGWQAEVAMRATPVDPDDPESQSVWDRVQDLIAAMPDGIEKITAQTVLARGKIRRDSPTLAQLAPLVPLSGERVDDMFRLAGSIEA